MDNKNTGISDAQREKVRAGIYPMAGIFLFVQAYGLFHEISATSGTQQIITILFTILFAVAGLGLNIIGLSMVYKMGKKMKEEKKKQEETLE